MRKIHALGLLVSVLALCALACGEEEGAPPAEGNNEPGQPVGVRLFQSLESLGGDLDVIFRDAADNNISHEGLGFRQVSEYIDVPAGIWTVIFFDAASGQPLADLTIDAFNVEQSATKTIILTEDEGGAPRVHIIPEVLRAPAENSARLRFLHQANAPAIDIYNQADGVRHATSIKYGQLTEFFELPGAPYTFEVFEEGSVTEKLTDMGDLALLPARVYSIILLGDAEAGTLSTVLLTDTSF